MADEEKKVVPQERISEKQRFNYIGFEVFPGSPKDLFKSDAEKKKLIEQLHARRGETGVREHCTLMEERVSFVDRLVLTVACVVIVVTLFLPWYSAYNEVVEEVTETATTAMTTDSLMADSALTDSAMLAANVGDSAAMLAALNAGEEQAAEGTTELAETPEVTADEGTAGPETAVAQGDHEDEELIHGYVAKKKVQREYSKLSGVGSVIALGSVGSLVFSSGGILILTAIILLIYTLGCIGLPLYTLWGLYGTKGSTDDKALQLKRIAKLNWIPVVLLFVALVLSFLGAEYGFDPTVLYASIGSAYGPGVFLGSLSWGLLISLAAFIMLAVKGIEI
jgi:hypothetical protein